jgi:hypothetical protein
MMHHSSGALTTAGPLHEDDAHDFSPPGKFNSIRRAFTNELIDMFISACRARLTIVF